MQQFTITQGECPFGKLNAHILYVIHINYYEIQLLTHDAHLIFNCINLASKSNNYQIWPMLETLQ